MTEIAETIANTAPSFLLQNLGAIRGITANDIKTITNGADSVIISSKLISI